MKLDGVNGEDGFKFLITWDGSTEPDFVISGGSFDGEGTPVVRDYEVLQAVVDFTQKWVDIFKQKEEN